MKTIPKWSDAGRELHYEERLEEEIKLLRSALERIAHPTPTGDCGYCHSDEAGAHKVWCPRQVALDHLGAKTAVEEDE